MLSGVGWRDGTNPIEVAFVMHALEAAGGAKMIPCAPDIEFPRLVNYRSEKILDQKRNILEECYRMINNTVYPLGEIDPAEIDGLIITGGEGILYNLSDFSTGNENIAISEKARRLVQGVFLRGKPIGTLGYGGLIPVFALIKVATLILTIGKDSAVAGKLEKAGAMIIKAAPEEVIIDDDNRFFSNHGVSPESSVIKTLLGISRLVEEVVTFKKKAK